MVASAMVREEVNFLQEVLLKKINYRWNKVPGSRFSVEIFGWWVNWGPLTII